MINIFKMKDTGLATFLVHTIAMCDATEVLAAMMSLLSSAVKNGEGEMFTLSWLTLFICNTPETTFRAKKEGDVD